MDTEQKNRSVHGTTLLRSALGQREVSHENWAGRKYWT